MERKDFNEVLKAMLETGENYILSDEVKVTITYPEKIERDRASGVDKLDVQIHVSGLTFRSFGGSSGRGLTMVDHLTTMQELLDCVKGALLIDSLLINHGFEMMLIEEIKRELDFSESKELSTIRTKSDLLDGILDRISISQKEV